MYRVRAAHPPLYPLLRSFLYKTVPPCAYPLRRQSYGIVLLFVVAAHELSSLFTGVYSCNSLTTESRRKVFRVLIRHIALTNWAGGPTMPHRIGPKESCNGAGEGRHKDTRRKVHTLTTAFFVRSPAPFSFV